VWNLPKGEICQRMNLFTGFLDYIGETGFSNHKWEVMKAMDLRAEFEALYLGKR